MLKKWRQTRKRGFWRKETNNSTQSTTKFISERKFNIKRKKLIKQYLRKQEYSFAREIPLPLLDQASTQFFVFININISFDILFLGKNSQFSTPKKFMTNIWMKHEKEGFMRRNKLLLEYLIHERLRGSIHTAS